MDDQDLDNIETLIGYEFEERMLLQQAFIRRSYSQERGGQNNEVLEFIGDRALDFVVVKKLADIYGSYDKNDEFASRYQEGKLTKLKEKLVERSMLARRIDALGLADYLIMGKGDIAINVQNEESVKEDLFESIIGAVTLDCDWDIDTIQDVVETMLDIEFYLDNGFDDENNYVDLVQQWLQNEYNLIPVYEFSEYDEGFECFLQLPEIDEEFTGDGYSKSSARMNTAAAAYEYLEENGYLTTMRDEIGEPSETRAVSQLNELAQKGYIDFPEYEFYEDYDEDGNPLWTCVCGVDGYDNCYENTCSSKKAAKQASAYEMLLDILGDDDGDMLVKG